MWESKIIIVIILIIIAITKKSEKELIMEKNWRQIKQNLAKYIIDI